MTKEEFDALENKWHTVYIDGYKPIWMVSKYSSKKDHILWRDSDERTHTIHYSKVELNRIDRTEELIEFAKGLMIGDYYYDRSDGVRKRVRLKTFRMIGNRDLNIGIGTEPIMLTKEMLEKNGFDIGNVVAIKRWGGNDDGDVFDYTITCDFCMDGVFKYIHIRAPHIELGMPLSEVNEFLHLLRLCGLGEMADDFEL